MVTGPLLNSLMSHVFLCTCIISFSGKLSYPHNTNTIQLPIFLPLPYPNLLISIFEFFLQPLQQQQPQRSSMTGVPLLSLEGALSLNPTVDPFQNEALVEMWMEFKIKPLLNSITKHFLSCLSTKNFSCSTYQTVYV